MASITKTSNRTLSLKCPCGYIKHDVVCLGRWHEREKRVLHYCGGLFLVNENGDGVTCKKCGAVTDTIEFFCAFCNKVTNISVEERLAKPAGRTMVVKMAVHDTVLFCVEMMISGPRERTSS